MDEVTRTVLNPKLIPVLRIGVPCTNRVAEHVGIRRPDGNINRQRGTAAAIVNSECYMCGGRGVLRKIELRVGSALPSVDHHPIGDSPVVNRLRRRIRQRIDFRRTAAHRRRAIDCVRH